MHICPPNASIDTEVVPTLFMRLHYMNIRKKSWFCGSIVNEIMFLEGENRLSAGK